MGELGVPRVLLDDEVDVTSEQIELSMQMMREKKVRNLCRQIRTKLDQLAMATDYEWCQLIKEQISELEARYTD